MTALRQTLLKAIGGAAVSVAMLGAMEASLRLVDLPASGLFRGDPAWVWTPRPGFEADLPFGDGSFAVHIGEHGFRGEGPPAEGPWTLALGCSTTFGWGVSAEEAWPARLEALTGEEVVNGGVPGWSTEQARRGLAEWLALGPERVVLAYIVRDAWPAARVDAQARPTPVWMRTNLARLLQGGMSEGSTSSSGASVSRPDPSDWPTTRVPPARYGENLDAIEALVAEHAPGAEVLRLAFPQPEPLPEWESVLASGGPTAVVRLPREAFFAHDPVHLTAAGHQQLAQALAEGQGGLSPAAPAPSP